MDYREILLMWHPSTIMTSKFQQLPSLNIVFFAWVYESAIISPFILEFVADLLGSNAGGAGNALGLQIIGGPKVTILASKTSRKYSIFLSCVMVYSYSDSEVEIFISSTAQSFSQGLYLLLHTKILVHFMP